MTQKRGLGRGLGALIPGAGAASSASDEQEQPLRTRTHPRTQAEPGESGSSSRPVDMFFSGDPVEGERPQRERTSRDLGGDMARAAKERRSKAKAPAKQAAAGTAASTKKASADDAPATKAPVKRTAAAKASAAKAPAKRTAASKPEASKSPSTTTPAAKTPAKQSTSAKAPARKGSTAKASAEKTPARQASAPTAASKTAVEESPVVDVEKVEYMKVGRAAEAPAQAPQEQAPPAAVEEASSAVGEDAQTTSPTEGVAEPRPTEEPAAGARDAEATGGADDAEAAADAAGTETARGDAENRLVPVPGAEFAEIPIHEIRENPRNPRTMFDDDELDELAFSLREVGVLQPVVVRPISVTENGESFELVMGERRWRASQRAGLTSIPAIIRETSDDDLLRDALLENLHRSQLNPLEEAAAYQQLLEDFGCTQDELSERIGRSRPQITNTLRLMRLPALVQRRLASGALSAGHARALLSLDSPALMEELAQRIVAEGLSVRAVERLVARGVQPASASRTPRRSTYDPHVVDVTSRLSKSLETPVRIDVGKRKGRITLEFTNLEDLDRLVERLGLGDGEPDTGEE